MFTFFYYYLRLPQGLNDESDFIVTLTRHNKTVAKLLLRNFNRYIFMLVVAQSQTSCVKQTFGTFGIGVNVFA